MLHSVLGLLKYLWNVWNNWGIEILIFVSFALQTVLTLCGNRRRYIPGFWIRFTVWSTYLLTGSVAKVIIGKLSANDCNGNDAKRQLEALFAPLLLVQLGNPDTITAYSIEDNRLGLRQLLNLIFQVGIVVYILIRCWTSTPLSFMSFLYLPLFLAGLIKYGEVAWALKSALRNFGLNTKDIDKEANVPALFFKLPRDVPGLELILKAYCRFDCFKPHLENWFYKPFHESLSWMSIDEYSSEDVFKIIDAELGFMYDVLYTKAPIIYTWKGCILRIISFFSLVSTLCGFSIGLIKKQISDHWEFRFTLVVLILTIILEVYQIILLPFSDWAIIQMIVHHDMPVMRQCLRVLGPRSCKWRKWSNSLGQFNLLNFCLHDKQLKFSRIIKFRGMDMEFRKSSNRKRVRLPTVLKEVIVQELKEVDKVRDPKRSMGT